MLGGNGGGLAIGDTLRENASVGLWANRGEAELLQVIRTARPLRMNDVESDELLACMRTFLARHGG